MTVLNGTAVGLFGYVGPAGTVYNVKVAGTSTGNENVAGVVGINSGSVKYCSNSVSISGTMYLNNKNTLGGVVATNESTGYVYACSNGGAISGFAYYMGGVVGFNKGTIYNAYNRVVFSVGSEVMSIGGIVGYTETANVGCFYNTNSVQNSAGTNPKGVIIGSVKTGVTISDATLYYLSGSASSGYGQSKTKSQIQNIVNEWNTTSVNHYMDNIWEIRGTENDSYPVFVVKKNFNGSITITGTYASSTESFAMSFARIDKMSGSTVVQTWNFMLIASHKYAISNLDVGTYNITVYASINHSAVATLSGTTITSITLTESQATNGKLQKDVIVTVTKIGASGFYNGSATTDSIPTTYTLSSQRTVEVEQTENVVKLENAENVDVLDNQDVEQSENTITESQISVSEKQNGNQDIDYIAQVKTKEYAVLQKDIILNISFDSKR